MTSPLDLATAGLANATTAPEGAPSALAGAGVKSDSASAAHDEKYWKNRMSLTRQALDRSRTFAEALQSRVNALTNDVASRDDPFQRAVLVQDRDKAIAEIDRVTQEIEALTKEIGTIEDDARKAGVPAGWLR